MANNETQTEVQEEVQSEAGQAQQAPGLSLQDLILVVQIITLSNQRGTFRVEELAQVGALYNKLVAFLQSTGALVPTPSEAEAPTEEPAADSSEEN